MKKRIFALILVLILSLSSCSSVKSETVFAYGDAVMNENLYFYELAMMKTQLLQEYSGATTDVPALWASEIGENVTFDDYAYAQCQMNIATVLFFADYAMQNGGALTNEDKKTIDTAIDDIISEMGSKAAVNKYLEAYTINLDMYKDYLELYALYNKGITLAYSENGEYAIDRADMEEYFRNNFVTVKHIAIGTEYAGTDEDGNFVYYTEEEKKEKREIIDSITDALAKGEDFDKFYSLSEDKSSETYPDGYTITKGVLDTSMQGYENVAFSLEEGEWDTFELEGTSVYIIKRVPLLESDFMNCANSILNTLVQVDMAETVIENYDNFIMNQDIIDNYNMAMVPVVS